MADVQVGNAGLSSLPRTGRLLGVDIGDVRIGLALSDPGQVVASPLETIAGSAEETAVADSIVAAVIEHGACAVVVGYPRTMTGREGGAARRCRLIAELVAKELVTNEQRLPVLLWDERFTTVEAERVLIEADVRRRRRRDVVDRIAASLILAGVLEARRKRTTWG